MYQPERYKKQDPDFIFKFIERHPFATFVLKGDRLLATHIPVLVKGNPTDFILYAHIANHNEQLKYLQDGAEALFIFQGAHGYVSSSWYTEKDISTWDYSAVHVNVRLKLQSEAELEDSLKKLVNRFENDQENPLIFEYLPAQMVRDHLPLITGFWGEPIKIQAIAKLHQGSKEQDVKSVVDHLDKKAAPQGCPLSENIKSEHGINN